MLDQGHKTTKEKNQDILLEMTNHTITNKQIVRKTLKITIGNAKKNSKEQHKTKYETVVKNTKVTDNLTNYLKSV